MRRRPAEPLDVELADLPPEQRWRVWMGRVEAVIFAAATPVHYQCVGLCQSDKAEQQAG